MIPGKPREEPTPAQCERAAEEGWENYIWLKKELEPHGITPIHTFHRGENVRWLKRLRDEAEFFCLAPKTSKETTLEQAISSGALKIEGRKETVTEFMGLLDTFPFWFNIVTP